ncbi:MAG: GntR family transcriptional regulator [Candidatus Nanopelagicales bacterium]
MAKSSSPTPGPTDSPSIERAGVRGASTSAEWITPQIRTLILNAAIRPGERINVKGLEKRFGVSHIPIREALRQLEAEGLVTLLPQRGAIAARVSTEELEDVYDLRRIIEPVVAGRAAERATQADRDAVVAAMNRLDRLELADDPSFFEAHWDFHWSILKPGSTPEVERVVHQLWQTSERYIRLTRGTATDEAHHQHELMTGSLASGDSKALSKYLSQHLTLTGEAIRALFEQRRDEYVGIQD